MQSGGTYLLGSLERGKRREGKEGVLQWSKNTDQEHTRLEVWAMAVEVQQSTGDVGFPVSKGELFNGID